MKNSHSFALQARMLLWIGAAVSLGLAATITLAVYLVTKIAREGAINTAVNESNAMAELVAGQLNEPVDTARSLASSFEAIISSGEMPSRTLAQSLLAQTLTKNTQILGVWTCWEPNAYDNRDAQWANQEGHDATGRLIAHYFRQGSTVVSEPLRDYATPGAGDYYLVPREAAREVLLEPTLFKVGDKEVLKTTIVIPILDKGKVAGVVGIDFTLQSLGELLAKQKISHGGYAALISNQLRFVYHATADRIGKGINDVDRWIEPFIPKIKAGEPFVTESYSYTRKTTAMRIGAPVRIGQTGAPWLVLITWPADEVMASVNSLRNLTLLVGAGLDARPQHRPSDPRGGRQSQGRGGAGHRRRRQHQRSQRHGRGRRQLPGRLGRGNQFVLRGTHQHDQTQRRTRRARPCPRAEDAAGSRTGPDRNGNDARRHARNPGLECQHRQNHQDHRRDRLSDQHPRPQRRRRGRPRG
jgi:methyl-accepting chemotaxis protein